MINHHPPRLLAFALGTWLSFSLALAHSSPAANFVVRAADGRVDCEHVAQQCETLRVQLFKKWHQSPCIPWNPRCEIVIHSTRDSYTEHVGPGSEQTNGSTLIRLGNEGVVHRRIDLLTDSSGRLTALPHELTHVVLADVFEGRKPPPWADEGIATLADSESKRSLHHRDCRDAIESGAAFRVAELLTLERLSRPEQVAAFYGQSLSLTRFLVAQNDAQELVHFIKHAMEVGYDRAVQKHYGFDTITDLELAWRRFEQANQSIHQGHPSSDTLHGEPFVELISLNVRSDGRP